jgi:hypothetical protein
VHHAVRVGVLERGEHGQRPARHGGGVLSSHATQPRAQALALQQAHRDPRAVGRVDAKIEHVDDVRVPHRREHLGLAQKALHGVGALAQRGVHHLQGDAQREVRAGGLEDRAHAAVSDGREQGEAPDGVADHRGRAHRAVIRCCA